ncbi:MAG: hypothetical protein U5K00_17920 [Melioribacteraceae bacterium]|nr:hypothetical protein [Melioribacteraceae bacterium]
MGDLFITTRSNRPDVEDLYTVCWYTSANDRPAPPVLYWREQPRRVDYETDFEVRAFINDETGFSSVDAVINDNIYTMYDDGNHNDSLAGDYIFGATIDGISKNVSQNPGDVYDIDLNNFYLPMRNNGVLADVSIRSSANLNLEVEDLDANKRIFRRRNCIR